MGARGLVTRQGVMMISARVIFCFLLQTAATGGQQRFLSEPEAVLVRPGAEARLACVIQNMGLTSQCRWQKDVKPVGLFSGKYVMAEDSQVTGDCSLRVMEADPELDDGLWQCGVTSSNVSLQDSLVSSPARLSVMVPPAEIVIMTEEAEINETLTVTEAAVSVVRCVTRLSNPAALITWRLGPDPLSSEFHSQTEAPEPGEPGKLVTTSELRYTFTRAHEGQQISCEVSHEAYESGRSESVRADLDILYVPHVSISSVTSEVLEAGVGSLSLSCEVEANPAATSVMWLSVDTGEVVSYGPRLEFSPVLRSHAGEYGCVAANTAGNSSLATYSLDVLYGPSITAVEPLGVTSVSVGDSKVLRCRAEASPAPVYTWLHRTQARPGSGGEGGQVEIMVSRTGDLELTDIGYLEAGEYRCRATNTIGGAERSTESEVITVKVSGPPRLYGPVSHSVHVGDSAVLEMRLCSDPAPLANTWRWEGGVVLPAGASLDSRFRAELESSPDLDKCFTARLTVEGAEAGDSRQYIVRAENDRGMDMVTVQLLVKESLSMASVIGVTLGLLLILLVLVTVITICYNRQKLCFKGEKEKPTDSGNRKEGASDDSRGGRHVMVYPPLATKV